MAPSIDCYKLLQLDKETANINDIKKAYRKLALKYHPDKQPSNATEEEKAKANSSFQELGMAYAVLADVKRKAKYDKTGNIEEGEFEGDKDWIAYFKELWTGIVNSETIEAQRLKYQGSEEEKKDLLEAYDRYKGNMDKILQVIECCTANDGYRFEEIIRNEKRSKILTQFNKTTTKTAHQNRINKEAKEVDEYKKESDTRKKEEESSLLALIQQRNKKRQENMNSIISSIEEKHHNNSKQQKKRKQDDLPSEEEFLKLQASLFDNHKKSKK